MDAGYISLIDSGSGEIKAETIHYLEATSHTTASFDLHFSTIFLSPDLEAIVPFDTVSNPPFITIVCAFSFIILHSKLTNCQQTELNSKSALKELRWICLTEG